MTIAKDVLAAAGYLTDEFKADINNSSEKEINEMLPTIKVALLEIPRASAVEIINKFKKEVQQAKSLKSTNSGVFRQFIKKYVNSENFVIL